MNGSADVIEKHIKFLWKWNDSLDEGNMYRVSHRGSGGKLTDASGFAWVISETDILTCIV